VCPLSELPHRLQLAAHRNSGKIRRCPLLQLRISCNVALSLLDFPQATKLARS
jgi:hypothetical protein